MELIDTSENKAKSLEKFYIDEEKLDKDKRQYPICIASFPRSGNTMLRTIYEAVTNTYTGDDMIIEGDGILQGLGKRGIISNIFLMKTHYPYQIYEKNLFKSQGALVIIRNPFDLIDSFFELNLFLNHEKKLSRKFRALEQTKKLFNEFIEVVNCYISSFHQYWIDNSKKVPVKFLRYEDFCNDKRKGTIEIFDFLSKFNSDKIYFGGLSSEEIIKRIDELDLNELKVYKIRSGCKHYQSIQKNYFDSDQIERIIKNNYNILNFFGYIEDFKSSNIDILKLATEKVSKDQNDKISHHNNEYLIYNNNILNVFKNIDYDNQQKRQTIDINAKIEGRVCQFKPAMFVFDSPIKEEYSKYNDSD